MRQGSLQLSTSRLTVAYANADGIEIPVLYHFFGIQSILPSEFIENIEFLPGGFGVEEGRATGGVRAQRFLKGETRLVLAWVGPRPPASTTKRPPPAAVPPGAGGVGRKGRAPGRRAPGRGGPTAAR